MTARDIDVYDDIRQHWLYHVNAVPQGEAVDRVTRIYALRDEHGEVRYVGKTISELLVRLNGHIKHARKNTKCYARHWVKSMLDKGLRPTIILLEVVPAFGEWWTCEADWIERHLLNGCNLTNHTAGGNGPGIFSQQSREKLGQSIRAVHAIYRSEGRPYTTKPPSEESIKKNSETHRANHAARKEAGIVHPRTVNRRAKEQLEGRSPPKSTAYREAKALGIPIEKKPRAKETKKRKPFTESHLKNISLSSLARNAAREAAGIVHPRTVNRRARELAEGRKPAPSTAYRELLKLRKNPADTGTA